MVAKFPELVGIVNVNPHSFSDGGNYLEPKDAIAHIDNLIKDGANVIDIGAESTRPGATEERVTPEQEWQRLEPAIKHLHGHDIIVSVDTRNYQTAHKAIKLGVNWINDVSGLSDPNMLKVVAPSNVRVVLMHSLTVPADPNIILVPGSDPVKTIYAWAEKNIKRLESAGINKSRIIFDPGIGFGKNAEQSYEIITRIKEFRPLGVDILVGHSRKSFLAMFSDDNPKNRDKHTIEISKKLIDKGVDYLRVHDVKGHVSELRIMNCEL